MDIVKTGFWPWFLQRITAAILIAGMSVHIIALALGQEKISFELVSDRLSHIGWIVFDLILLSATIFHGFSGLWAIILDFKPDRLFYRTITYTLTITGLILLIYGTLTLWAFIR